MLAAKRPGHQDRRRRNCIRLLKITDFAPVHRQDQGVGRRHTVVHPATGAMTFALLLKGGRRRRVEGELVHLLWPAATGGPTRGQAGPISITRYSRSARAIPESRSPLVAGIRKGRSAPSMISGLFYPRRRQRNAHAGGGRPTRPSRSIPVKGRKPALEGMEFEVFDGGKGNMAQGTITSSSSRSISPRSAIAAKGSRSTKKKTGWGLEARCQDRYGPRTTLPHHPARWNGPN